MKDEAYVRQLKMRWMELRTTRYSDTFISSKLDSLQAVLTANGAVARDNQAWSNHFEVLSSQKESLYNYIKARLLFLDAGWLAPNPSDEEVGGGIQHPERGASPTMVSVYSVHGVEQQHLQKGFNIVRYSDGSIRKVWIR